MESKNDNPLAGLAQYELRNLAVHLDEAGRAADLHKLLSHETTDARNAWFDRKDALGDTSGYLTDVARAWKLAEQLFTSSRTQPAIALQCR